jgi:hypothetical protein
MQRGECPRKEGDEAVFRATGVLKIKQETLQEMMVLDGVRSTNLEASRQLERRL